MYEEDCIRFVTKRKYRMSEFLQAINISKTVTTQAGSLTLLENINVAFNKASRNAIMGASGSGKTTLLGLLAGLDQPSNGKIIFQGEELTRLDEDQRARRRLGQVGFVFQSFQLLPQLTALENVMLPLEMANAENIRQQALDILDLVGMSHRVTHYPNQLSGGEQQRCALARAYITKPCILFADEPTGNLDQQTGLQIIELLFKLNETEGTCLIMATHDSKLASRCENVIRLENGHIR